MLNKLSEIEYHSGIPVYKQLINTIMTGINDGQLAVGEKLPPIRKLADALDINVNTVAKVYKELEIREVVESQAGKGCYILEPKKAVLSPNEKHVQLENLYSKFISEAKSFLISEDEVLNFIKGRG